MAVMGKLELRRLLVTFLTFCVISTIVTSTKTHVKENLRNRIDKARFPQPEQKDGSNTDIKKVHIVFMNHLDVGYDGVLPKIGFVNIILNLYFTEYFPRAAALHKTLEAGGYTETFKYTTHPWLVSLYLDCPPNLVLAGIKLQCPNATEIATFKDAVKSGAITWHGGPMNMQSEFLSEWLFTFGLNLSRSLDERFAIKRPMRVFNQRDVPGLTSGVIPLLLKAGVDGVAVGVNPMTAPPAVPNVFRWRYGDKEVLATWHKGGYPNNPGPNPANPGGLSVQDCTTVPGHPEALCYAFRTDNSGPPKTLQEFLGYYEILRKEFPGAELTASTMEDFLSGLQPIRDQLPVVTKEIGDTWIMGVASDPRKTAEYRAAARVMGVCIESGACDMADSRVFNASRFLLKMGEHTWGLPSVYDTVNWTNPAFYRASSGANYVNCTRSWVEQRQFLDLTLEALENHSIVADIRREVAGTRPRQPDLSGYRPLAQKLWYCLSKSQPLYMTFSPEGALDLLQYNGTTWANGADALGKFLYTSYNETDFQLFASLYDYHNVSAGFNKVNVTLNALPQSRTWPSMLNTLYAKTDGDCDVWAHVSLVDKLPVTQYGAPLDVWIRYVARPAHSPGVDIDLQWFGKTSTRLPESLMYSFTPAPAATHKFYLSKLGSVVDPMNGVLNGSNYLHALDEEGLYYVDSKTCGGLQLSAPDAPLVRVISESQPATSYAMPLKPIPDTITGVAFNMYNNVWDTNYIFWYPYLKDDVDHRARFSIKFVTPGSEKSRLLKKRLATMRGI